MAETPMKPRWPRIVLVSALVLLLLYALVGFLLLPWWLEKQVPSRLSQHLGWQGTVENIALNPFALSLEVSGLRAEDGASEPALDIQRLYVNLGFWPLFRGVTDFQEITLDQPHIRLDLMPGYELKAARDWAEHNPAPEEASQNGEESDDEAKPPRLHFGDVVVNDGQLLLRDLTGGEPRSFPISPLDFNLNDLATWRREGTASNYYLLAAVGSQTIEWQGNLSLLPLESSGYLKVADVQSQTLVHFLADRLPLELRDGQISVSSNYRFGGGDPLRLETSGGEISVEGLVLASNSEQENPELRTASMHLDDIGFSLHNRTLSTGTLAVESLELGVRRNASGELDLLQALAGNGADDGDDSDAGADNSDQPPFQWEVAGIDISTSQVSWRDEVPRNPADVRLTGIEVTLGRLSSDMNEPVDYQLQSDLKEGGSLSLTGQVTPVPFNLEAGVSASDLVLAQFQPYLRESANATLVDGRLQVDGNLNLDDQDDPMTGTFSGNGEVSGLNLRLPDATDPMLAWQALRLEGIEYNLAPARLEIATVTLAEPDVSVIRAEDGVHNLQRIARTPESASGDSGSAEQPETSDSSPKRDQEDEAQGFIFRIQQLLLEEGRLAYTDRSLDPPFSTELVQLSGSVSGISNVRPQQGQVALDGMLEGSAPLRIEGSLGTLGSDEQTDIRLSLDNYSTHTLSPYFGRYLGYGVDSGKLRLDLDYNIQGSRIDASNQVIMDQLELGAAVDSPEAVSVPVKLGLALLRNRQGVIDISLPISGDLSDPQFSVSQIVGTTFVNLLTRAASSPFSMLGSLVDLAGFSADELGKVTFEPGMATLDQAQRDKLKALATALTERPSLLLSIRGAVAPEADEPALRRKRLYERAGIDTSMNLQERLPLLEQAYGNTIAEPPLDTLRQQVENAQGQSWEASLLERLLPTVQLPPEALGQLAQARAGTIRSTLTDEYSTPEDQLFMQDPGRNAPLSEADKVIVEFKLEPR